MFKEAKVFDRELLEPGDILLVRRLNTRSNRTYAELVAPPTYHIQFLLVLEVEPSKIVVRSATPAGLHECAGGGTEELTPEHVDEFEFAYHLSTDMVLDMMGLTSEG